MGVLLSAAAMTVALTGCNDGDADAAKGDGKTQSTPAGDSTPSKGKGKGEGVAKGEPDPASGGGDADGSGGGGATGANGSGGSADSSEQSTHPCSHPDLKVTLTVQPGEQNAGAATVQAKNTGSAACHLPKVLDLRLWENSKEVPVELQADPTGEGLKLAPSQSALAYLTFGLPEKGEEVGSLVDSAQFEFNEVGKVEAELKAGIGMEGEGMVVMDSDFTLSDFQRD
ncbi:DUF4232 domain-containing protein [Streptomyces sp. NPDC048248]|uniref:DUF4232 domain-containing protein n=1 Tax=Streptomyces sp. NPDC048248 TaxID=3365523 RepID=UPI00371C6A33